MPHRQTKKTQLALCLNYPFASGSVFKQISRCWQTKEKSVLIPLNQGLFLNVIEIIIYKWHPSLNPFESGTVFKQRGAGFSFLIKCLQSSFPIFFLSPKQSHFFTPAVFFILCRHAYATPLVGGVNAPCPAQRSSCCCRCGGYRLVMQVMSPNTTPGELAMAIGQSRCFLKRPYTTHRVQLMAAQSGWIGLPLCPARLA